MEEGEVPAETPQKEESFTGRNKGEGDWIEGRGIEMQKASTLLPSSLKARDLKYLIEKAGELCRLKFGPMEAVDKMGLACFPFRH